MQWVDERAEGHVITNFLASVVDYFFLPMVLRCARESSAYNNYWRDQSQVKMLLLHLCSLPSFHMKKVQTCMIGLRSLHDIHS